MVSTLAAQNYLVYMYERCSASAIAAIIILRAIASALFPLAGPPLYDRLVLGWGNGALAFLAMFFIPVLTVMARCSRKLRDQEHSIAFVEVEARDSA